MLSWFVLAVMAVAADSAAADRDPCRLLTDAEVQAVQGQTPTARVKSAQPAGDFALAQCFYRAPDFTRSVSVAVAAPQAANGHGSSAREYWRRQFHKPPSPPGRKKKEPPAAVNGLGEEAFWVGDTLQGALYVLKGDVFLRVSVGGAGTPQLDRARVLAAKALARLSS